MLSSPSSSASDRSLKIRCRPITVCGKNRPIDTDKRTSLDENDHSLWMQLTAQQSSGRRRRPFLSLKKPRGSKDEDLILSDFVDPSTQKFMALPVDLSVSRNSSNRSLNGSASTLATEDLSIAPPMGGDAKEARTRRRFIGKYLQLDVIASMRAYLEDGFRETIYRTPKREQRRAKASSKSSSNRNPPKASKKHSKKPQENQRSSPQNSSDIEELLTCLQASSSMISEQQAILAQIQREHAELTGSTDIRIVSSSMPEQNRPVISSRKKKDEGFQEVLQSRQPVERLSFCRNHPELDDDHGSAQPPTSTSSSRRAPHQPSSRTATTSTSRPPLDFETSSSTCAANGLVSTSTNFDQHSSMTLQVDGRSIKVLSPSSVEDAILRGEEVVSLVCISCQNDLLTTANTTMVYCPVCGTLANTDMLLRS